VYDPAVAEAVVVKRINSFTPSLVPQELTMALLITGHWLKTKWDTHKEKNRDRSFFMQLVLSGILLWAHFCPFVLILMPTIMMPQR